MRTKGNRNIKPNSRNECSRQNSRLLLNELILVATCVEAKHEETDVLDEHRDQTEEKPRGHGYQGVAPFCRKWLSF